MGKKAYSTDSRWKNVCSQFKCKTQEEVRVLFISKSENKVNTPSVAKLLCDIQVYVNLE